MKASAARCAILAWMVLLLATGQSAAKAPAEVQIELFSGRPQEVVTVRDEADLAPVLDRCLFENGEPEIPKFLLVFSPCNAWCPIFTGFGSTRTCSTAAKPISSSRRPTSSSSIRRENPSQSSIRRGSQAA